VRKIEKVVSGSRRLQKTAAGLTAQLKELGERIGRPVAYLMTQIAYAESQGRVTNVACKQSTKDKQFS